VCPVDAIKVRKEGGVRIDLNKCIGCKNCKDACPLGAIFWDEEANKPLVCIYCGYCAKFCPHHVLALEKKEIEEEVAGAEKEKQEAGQNVTA
jgi:formate hydrogenlyase subunit 6/NADH:ubiquinone oxidoreductase subunit I